MSNGKRVMRTTGNKHQFLAASRWREPPTISNKIFEVPYEKKNKKAMKIVGEKSLEKIRRGAMRAGNNFRNRL